MTYLTRLGPWYDRLGAAYDRFLDLFTAASHYVTPIQGAAVVWLAAAFVTGILTLLRLRAERRSAAAAGTYLVR